MSSFCQVCSFPRYSMSSKRRGFLVLNLAEAEVPRISKYQLFFSPGAIRCIFIVKGNIVPFGADSASHNRVALSQVLQGAVPPFPSWRSVTRLERIARTLRGRHPARKGMWQI